MRQDDDSAIANVRAALKASFPATRFSVACFRRSRVGATYVIRWSDGPSEAAVENLVEPLKSGGMLLHCYQLEGAE